MLQHGNAQVNYEILLLEQMLVFKPWFYHLERDFPCIVLNHAASGWEFDAKIGQQIEQQIREDIASLPSTAQEMQQHRPKVKTMDA